MTKCACAVCLPQRRFLLKQRNNQKVEMKTANTKINPPKSALLLQSLLALNGTAKCPLLEIHSQNMK